MTKERITPLCARCNGIGHVATEAGEEGEIKSCPNCDGSGDGPEDILDVNGEPMP